MLFGVKCMATSSKPTFEEAIAELETIVEAMESGKLSLNESVEKFQRGQKLAQICQEALKAAEEKLRIYAEKDGAQACVKASDDVPF